MATQHIQLFPEQLCYVHCNLCNTILAVNVPRNMFNIVTIRCGHCANLLSVDMAGLLQSITLQDHQKIEYETKSQEFQIHLGSNSEFRRASEFKIEEVAQRRQLSNHPPEKRQRVPSAYNNFIKEEIQRIKRNHPEISHREAFSAAAKNWAHFPHIHFGLTLDSLNQQEKCDELISAPGVQKPNGNGFH